MFYAIIISSLKFDVKVFSENLQIILQTKLRNNQINIKAERPFKLVFMPVIQKQM